MSLSSWALNRHSKPPSHRSTLEIFLHKGHLCDDIVPCLLLSRTFQAFGKLQWERRQTGLQVAETTASPPQYPVCISGSFVLWDLKLWTGTQGSEDVYILSHVASLLNFVSPPPSEFYLYLPFGVCGHPQHHCNSYHKREILLILLLPLTRSLRSIFNFVLTLNIFGQSH